MVNQFSMHMILGQFACWLVHPDSVTEITLSACWAALVYSKIVHLLVLIYVLLACIAYSINGGFTASWTTWRTYMHQLVLHFSEEDRFGSCFLKIYIYIYISCP